MSEEGQAVPGKGQAIKPSTGQGMPNFGPGQTAPPNQPEQRTVPAGAASGRYEVWSGKSVEVGDKPATPGADLPNVFKPEEDAGHDTDAGVHRLLTDPRRKGTAK